MNPTNTGQPVNDSQHYSESREISIEEILQIVMRRKVAILIIMLLSLFGVVLFYFAQTPQYHAVSVMMINQKSSPEDLVDAVLGGGPAADSKMAQKDVELLQSVPISEMTVRALWNSPRRDSLEFFGHRPYVSPLRRMSSWVVPVRSGKREGLEIPQGTPRFDAMMRFYALQLNRRIRVEGSRTTSVLKVSVASPFPDEAVFLTDMLCEVYKKSDIQRNSEKYVQSNQFVADMLKGQQQQLVKADASLSKFMTDSQIYEVTGNTAALLAKLVELDARYNDVMAEYNITMNTRDFLEKKLTEADRELSSRISQNVNAQLGSIQDEIRARESEYINLLRDKSADDPEVLAKKREVDQVKSRYEQLSRSKIAGQIGYVGQAKKYSFDLISEKLQLERKLNQLKFSAHEYKRLKEYYENQLDRLPGKEQRFVRLQRDRDVVSKTYLFLKEKLDETRILIGSEVGSVSMIGSAFKPFVPESPDLKKNLLAGLVLGLVFAGAYVFVAESIDDRVNEEMLFFKSLGFSIWGVIPFLSSFTTSESGAGLSGGLANRFRQVISSITGKQEELEISPDAARSAATYPMMTDKLNSSFAESFRTLRTNLGFHMIDKQLKSVLVSGCSIGEGKSTVSANLAISWALAGKKTLIIDADLRRPSQHLILDKKRSPGLTDCLASEAQDDFDRFFQPTHVENLYVLTSGSPVPNPNEMLGSQRMKEFLEKIEGSFDRIIIDSPPIFISDAVQLVTSVDGVLITARLHYSSRSPLKQYASDHYLHSRIIGIALIDKPRLSQNRYGNRRYGYGRYGYSRYSNIYPEKL